MWIDDIVLRRCDEPIAIACWVPEQVSVVLGSSNDPSVECNVEACSTDGIEILKRAGGGGTVVLHPGCVVLTIGTWVKTYYQNDVYFRAINDSLRQILGEKWPDLLCLKTDGISDIVIEDRKVAGTSMFRSRNYLLYQASILVDPQFEILERYLRHPSREPAYRQGRKHRDFLRGLKSYCPGLTAELLVKYLQQKSFREKSLPVWEHFIPPPPEQFSAILARAARSENS